MKLENFTNWNTKTKKFQMLFYPLIIVLMLIVLALVGIYIYSTKNREMHESMYQYCRENRIEFPEQSALYSGDVRVIVQNGEQVTEADITPLYLSDEDSFILTTDMMWTDVSLNKEWFIPELTKITMDESGNIWCEIGTEKILLTGGILYNIDGIYIALDYGSVSWGGKKYEITPFSFFTIDGGMTRVYQYDEKALTFEEKKYIDIEFKADVGYSVLLHAGIYASSEGKRRLLAVNTMTLSNITEK